MITGDLRGKVDRLWEEFWTGGITNPLTVIEQITFLMFARLLDMVEAQNERKAKRTGNAFQRLFPNNAEGQALRWAHFKNLGSEEMLKRVRDGVFPHFRNITIDGASFAEYMKDAQFMIQKPTLLVSAVNIVDALPLGEADTKGDLYEYLLSKLTTAGINGQFRTPRHITRFMVELLEPKPTEIVGDPACGTGGFLVSAMQYLSEKYTSPEGIITDPATGQKLYSGDLLEPYREHIRKGMFHGFDFDATMLRISTMNLLLHGVEAPDIHYQDSLSGSFIERFPKQAEKCFDVILANPPFKGSLDEEDVHKGLLAKVNTKKTELLFVMLILRMLKAGGRSATIVPDGVLFGSSKAHQALRKYLVDANQLEAVISLPSGVFKPYAGVSTAILVFTKGGTTDEVLFCDIRADGYSLDDKRTPVSENDLPVILERWRKRHRQTNADRTDKVFLVPASEIRETKYDLLMNRYQQLVQPEESFEAPSEVLRRMSDRDSEIRKGMAQIKALLR